MSKLKEALNERLIKAEAADISHGKIPKEYKRQGIKAHQFADRKRKKYPLDDYDHSKAALNYFSKPKNRTGYSSAEVKQIGKRIIAACKRFKIQVSDSTYENFGLKPPKSNHMTKSEFALMKSKYLRKEKTKSGKTKYIYKESRQGDRRKGRVSDGEKGYYPTLKNKFMRDKEGKVIGKYNEEQGIMEKPTEEEIRKYSKKPGVKKQDGTGPYGRGAGPGKGKADGSGLKKKDYSKMHNVELRHESDKVFGAGSTKGKTRQQVINRLNDLTKETREEKGMRKQAEYMDKIDEVAGKLKEIGYEDADLEDMSMKEMKDVLKKESNKEKKEE